MNEDTENVQIEEKEVETETPFQPTPDELELFEKIRNKELSVMKTDDFNRLIATHRELRTENNQMRVDLLDAYKIITNILKIIQVRGIGLLFSIVDKKMVYTALKRMVAKESDKPLFNEEQSKKIGENFIAAVNNDNNVKAYVPRISELINKYAPMFNDKNKLQ